MRLRRPLQRRGNFSIGLGMGIGFGSGLPARAGPLVTTNLIQATQPHRESFANGALISSTTDFSGAGNVCTAAGADRMTMATGVLPNGLAAFASTPTTWLKCFGLAAQFSYSGATGVPFSIFQAFKQTGTMNYTPELFMFGLSTDVQVQRDAFMTADDANIGSDNRYNDHHGPIGMGAGPMTTNVWHITGVVFDGVWTSYYLDGKLLNKDKDSWRFAVTSSTYDAFAYWSECRGPASPSSCLSGYASECLFYSDAKSKADALTIMADMSARLGIAQDLSFVPGGTGTMYAHLTPNGLGYTGAYNGTTVADGAALNYWGEVTQKARGQGYNSSVNQGIYRANLWGAGKKAVEFNGTATIFGVDFGRVFSGNALPWTFGVVEQCTDLTADRCLWQLWNSSANGAYILCYLRASDGKYVLENKNPGATVTTLAGGTTDTGKHYVDAIFDGTTATLSVDGIAQASGAFPVGNANYGATVVVGGRTYNTGAGEAQSMFFKGMMRTAFSDTAALSGANLTNERTYLASLV